METKRTPPTGPTLRRLNVGFSPLYESLSEHLEVPKQKGAMEKALKMGYSRFHTAPIDAFLFKRSSQEASQTGVGRTILATRDDSRCLRYAV